MKKNFSFDLAELNSESLRQKIDRAMWNNTHIALSALVDNSILTQAKLKAQNRTDLRMREYCTVRMCTARGSGHSWAAYKVAYEYFNSVLFLSPNLQMRDRTKARFVNLNKDEIDASKTQTSAFCDLFKTIDGSSYYFSDYGFMHVPQHNFRGINLDAVIVDGTFGLSNAKEDEIYDQFSVCMVNNPYKIFIFIQ